MPTVCTSTRAVVRLSEDKTNASLYCTTATAVRHQNTKQRGRRPSRSQPPLLPDTPAALGNAINTLAPRHKKTPLCNTPPSAKIPPVKESEKTMPLAGSWPPLCALLVEPINANARDALDLKRKIRHYSNRTTVISLAGGRFITAPLYARLRLPAPFYNYTWDWRCR